jgi:hypothetical protein
MLLYYSSWENVLQRRVRERRATAAHARAPIAVAAFVDSVAAQTVRHAFRRRHDDVSATCGRRAGQQLPRVPGFRPHAAPHVRPGAPGRWVGCAVCTANHRRRVPDQQILPGARQRPTTVQVDVHSKWPTFARYWTPYNRGEGVRSQRSPSQGAMARSGRAPEQTPRKI